MSLNAVNKETGDLSQVAGSAQIAEDVSYDNTHSGIPANNVQDALDATPRIFYGSQAAWDELPLATKKQYDYAAFGENVDVKRKSRFIHISFDDVTTSIQNLVSNKATYTSLFDEPFFAFLKSLHEEYGARFSLYVFADTFANLDDTYAVDFANAKDWIKIGIHAPSSSTSFRFGSGRSSASTPADYNLLSRSAVISIWEDFVDHVKLVTGSYDSVDRMPRLHYFAAPLSVCRAMQRAKCGALGFLSADDDRGYNYWYEQQSVYQAEYAVRPDTIYDEVTDCVLVPTDFRGEWMDPGFTPTGNYDPPTEDTVYAELVKRNGMAKYQDTFQSLIWFTHEWQIYNGSVINDSKAQWVIDACQFAIDYGYDFDYPQYRLGRECKRISSNRVCFMTENVPTRDWSYRQLYTLPMVANKLNPTEGKPLIQFSQAGTEGYFTPSIGRAVYEVVFRIPTTDNTKRLLIDMNEINDKFPSDNVSFGIIQWCEEEVLMPKYSSVSRYYTNSVNSDPYKIRNSGKWLYTKSEGTTESDTVLDTVEIGGRTYAYFDLDDNCGYITVSTKRNYTGDLNYTMEQTMSLNRILSFTTVPKP